MQILVDADACPVKELIVKIAKEFNLSVTMFFDNAHVYEDGYSKVVILDQGRDSVDFELIIHVKEGDIVVTQDYGVATLALSKNAKVINQNGMIYTHNNIDSLLFQRHMSAQLRRQGKRIKSSKKRSKSDNASFEYNFLKLIKGN
ncbi:MAG: YaiI/YqxD family protein [Eubacteriales bacterium]